MRYQGVSLLVGIGVALLGVVSGSQQAAAINDTTFGQRIITADCTITETSNGSGTVVNSDCPPQPPTVASAAPRNGYPIIKGLYDAANTDSFRVFVHDRWYVLGTDPELTVAGNTWTLNLSSIGQPIPPGVYNVIAEMTDHEGVVHRDSTTNELKITKATPPEITSATAPNKKPVITGTYDAKNTEAFRVSFNGRWYVLGTDPELTVSGNTWRLDLSNQRALADGNYEIIAESTLYGGEVLRARAILAIKSDGKATELIHKDTDLARTGQAIYIGLVIGLVSVLVAAMLFLLARRRRHEQYN